MMLDEDTPLELLLSGMDVDGPALESIGRAELEEVRPLVADSLLVSEEECVVLDSPVPMLSELPSGTAPLVEEPGSASEEDWPRVDELLTCTAPLLEDVGAAVEEERSAIVELLT